MELFLRLVILTFSVFFVNSQIVNLPESQSEQEQNVIKSTRIISNYLESLTPKVYRYKEATLVDAQQKADITEVTLDIPVECIENYPQLRCSETLRCHGFVQGDRVLGDVKCVPKIKTIVEDEAPSQKAETPVFQETENPSLALSHETVSQASGEEFVAVRKSAPCLGCPSDLNPNVEGVDRLVQTALMHIESERNEKHIPIKVLRLQQEVVAGVKYILWLEVGKTSCSKLETQCLSQTPVETFICHVTYLQRPWISNAANVVSNNCTVSQEFVGFPDPSENEVVINKQPQKPSPEDRVPDFSGIIVDADYIPKVNPLSDLESQIIVETASQQPTEQTRSEVVVSSIVPAFAADTQAVDDLPSNSRNTEEGITPTEVANVEETTDNDRAFIDKFLALIDAKFFTNFRKTFTKSKNESSEESNENESKSNENDSGESLYTLGERMRRSIGRFEKIPPEEKILVQDLAHFAAMSLDAMDDDDNKRIVLQILSAKKLISDGIYYHLILRLGVSHCLEESPNENCHKNLIDHLTKVCKVQIHLTNEYTNPTVVKSQCQHIKKGKENRSNYSRYKRRIVGGQTPISIDDDRLTKYIKNSLKHLDTQSSHQNKLKALKIHSATVQVVAGAQYRIKTEIGLSDCLKNDVKEAEKCGVLQDPQSKVCDLTVWEKKWLGWTKTSIKCEDDPKEYKFETQESVKRKKRNIPLGGETPLPVDDKRLNKFVKNSLKHLDTQLGSENKLKAVKIHSASVQIVSGERYKIKAQFAPSDCSRNSPKDAEQCGLLQNSKSKICDLTVWEKAWLGWSKTTIKCDNEGREYNFETQEEVKKTKHKRDIKLGGETPISVDDKRLNKFVKNSLKHLDSQSSNDNRFKAIKIHSATVQIVSGERYRIKTQIALSDCSKNSQTEVEKCGLQQNAKSKFCDLTVWEKSWLGWSKTTIKCDNEGKEYNFETQEEVKKTKHKRSIRVGGETPISVDDQILSKYVKNSLKHLDTESKHDHKLKLLKIHSATVQIVAGQLYRIRTELGLSDCSKNDPKEPENCGVLEDSKSSLCDLKIWEKLWLGWSKTTIKCDDIDKEYSFETQEEVKKNKIKRDTFDVSKRKTKKYQFDHQVLFEQFIAAYNRTYDSQKEYKYRMKVFAKNLKRMHMLNVYEKGTARYGITRFADLSQKEFSRSLGLRQDLSNSNDIPFPYAQIPDVELPTEFDWRQKGAVAEVKDQGSCGSCWAFSVTGNVEGQYAIKYGKLLEFSEQELVDCDKSDQGCNGGLMDNAYRSIEKLGGLEAEKDYPYDGEDEQCHFKQSMVRVELSGAVNISQNETNMAKWLVQNGPISIAINANAMQFYVGGVSHPYKFLCNPKNLDHGVLIVGYGVHHYPLFNRTLPYWIVKNSWGPSWGEQGYYRVYRGDGTCGLNQTPSSAIVS